MNKERDYWKIGTIVLAALLIAGIPIALILRSRYPVEVFQGIIGLVLLLIFQVIFLFLYFVPSLVAFTLIDVGFGQCLF